MHLVQPIFDALKAVLPVQREQRRVSGEASSTFAARDPQRRRYIGVLNAGVDGREALPRRRVARAVAVADVSRLAQPLEQVGGRRGALVHRARRVLDGHRHSQRLPHDFAGAFGCAPNYTPDP